VSYVEIPWIRLLGAALLVVLAILLSWRQKLGLGVDLVVGAVRAAVQLIAIGFILVLLFNSEQPWLTLLALFVMMSVAAWTASRRVRHGPGWKALTPRAFLAIGVGFAVALLPVLAWVIPVRPLLSARYAIPIGGMVLATGMNTVTLVLERVFANAHQQGSLIEQALALGATPAQAMAPMQREAVRAAMLPSINALLTLGLVQLPGMMTGQILSGTDPTHAVRYQLVIMYQLVAVAAVAGAIAAWMARRALFDEGARLRTFSPAKKR
jgi:UDP-glucose/iron transport system permease protein